MAAPQTTARPSLTLVRQFNASPERVWHAWTDKEAAKIWTRPAEGYTIPLIEGELTVGGRYRMVMRAPDGTEVEASGVYREIVPHQRLVYTWVWSTTPEREALISITLRAAHGGTELTLKHEGLFDELDVRNHEGGWTNVLATFGEYLLQPAR